MPLWQARTSGLPPVSMSRRRLACNMLCRQASCPGTHGMTVGGGDWATRSAADRRSRKPPPPPCCLGVQIKNFKNHQNQPKHMGRRHGRHGKQVLYKNDPRMLLEVTCNNKAKIDPRNAS